AGEAALSGAADDRGRVGRPVGQDDQVGLHRNDLCDRAGLLVGTAVRLDVGERHAEFRRGELGAGRRVVAVVTGQLYGHHALRLERVVRVVDRVHRLEAVVRAGFQDVVLE